MEGVASTQWRDHPLAQRSKSLTDVFTRGADQQLKNAMRQVKAMGGQFSSVSKVKDAIAGAFQPFHGVP